MYIAISVNEAIGDKSGQDSTSTFCPPAQHEVHRNPCVEDDAEDALLDALCLAKCEELICVESGLKSVQKVSSMIVSASLYFASWTCILLCDLAATNQTRPPAAQGFKLVHLCSTAKSKTTIARPYQHPTRGVEMAPQI